MDTLRNPYVVDLLALSFAVALFVGSLISLAVGAGLIFRADASLRLFGRMNRWVSTRRALKPLEVPRGGAVATSGRASRLVGGAIFVAGGLYAAVVLTTKVDPGRVVSAFGFSGAPASLAGIVVQALVWVLIVGCSLAVAAGILLAGFPKMWSALETGANRWYSTRQLVVKADQMHLSLDRLVERFPRAAGFAIVALSMIPLIVSSALLFGRR